jgi:hypothetical protein
MGKDQVIRPARTRRPAVNGRYTVHRTYAWQVIRRQFRDACMHRALPCHICRLPIDYALPSQHPHAFEVDHARSVAEYPHLAYEWNNLRPSHSKCNRTRPKGKASDHPSHTSSHAPHTPHVWVRPTW